MSFRYNGQMFGEEKKLTDISDEARPSMLGLASHKASVIGYTKTNKLITALYMVTDILDKDEPLKNKLRTLGVEILSDISMSKPAFDTFKINQILSFLDIASAVNIISEMNCGILSKEFLKLDQSIRESMGNDSEARPNSLGLASRIVNLSEFFRAEELQISRTTLDIEKRGRENSKGHTRIGVQKGSTLMKALSDKTRGLSDRNNREERPSGLKNFDILKKQRREDIINIIKTIGGNATITDIKDKTQNLPIGSQTTLTSCSEKTLQRELVSMIKDGVLNKTGEKRWSRYKLVNLPG